MIKIALLCVTYHSYDCLCNYLDSVEIAYSATERSVDLDVFIADNSSCCENVNYLERFSFNAQYYKFDNVGYFGAIHQIMINNDMMDYDYVIISNVDLSINQDFFKKLSLHKCENNVGWIAPRIYSMLEQRDRNPQRLRRCSELRLILLQILYKFPLLFMLYYNTMYKRKKYLVVGSPKDVYAGHGSFIILTKYYLSKVGIVNYPVFLFCEEIYLAEMCRINNLLVRYEPDLAVTDFEHISVGKIKKKEYYRLNCNAIKYIRKRFYD